MPIAPLYEWEETEHKVEVRIALPGASKTKSDVSATDCMLKVNLAPYLLLLDLHGEVDSSRTVATFTAQEGVSFQLFKKAPGLWGRLDAVGSKEELTRRRNASIDKAHAEAEEARKARLERKQKEEKAAVDRQIELERAKRQEIERRKKAELDAERQGITNWKQQLETGAAAAGQQQQRSGGTMALLGAGGDESDYESDGEEEGESKGQEGEESKGGKALSKAQKGMPDHPDYYGRGHRKDPNAAANVAKPTHDSSDDDEDDQSEKSEKSEKQRQLLAKPPQEEEEEGGRVEEAPQESWRPLPPPRLRLEPVKVEFTALEMPHLPAREHREEELRAYKKTSAKDSALLADSNDVADRQPVFLKDKGDALFKQGNYRGAIAAYSRALELDANIPLIWSNRAAAHARLGQQAEAAGDCSAALQLLRPRLTRYEGGLMDEGEMVAFKKQLIKVLLRRGAALASLNLMSEALKDYEEAQRYDPSNEDVARDIAELKAALVPADAPTLRARGAARFAAGDAAGALEAFTALVALLPSGAERVAALSNRAAAHLVLGSYPAAHLDCCMALAIALKELHLTATETDKETDKETDNQPSVGSTGADQGGVSGDVVGLEAVAGSAGLAWGHPAPHAATAATSTAQLGSSSEVEAADLQLHAWLASLAAGCPLLTPVASPAAAVAAVAPVGGAAVVAAGTEAAGGSATAAAEQEGDGDQAAAVAGGTAAAVAAAAAPAASFAGLLASLGRLLARRAAVRGHMRQYGGAQSDFESAAHVMHVTGGQAYKQAALRADGEKMRVLCQQQQQGQEGQQQQAVAGAGQEGQVAAGAAGVGQVGSGAAAAGAGAVLGPSAADVACFAVPVGA